MNGFFCARQINGAYPSHITINYRGIRLEIFHVFIRIADFFEFNTRGCRQLTDDQVGNLCRLALVEIIIKVVVASNVLINKENIF
jgi:hypothetical protein